MFDELVLRETAEVIAPPHTALIIVDMQKMLWHQMVHLRKQEETSATFRTSSPIAAA